MMSSYVALRVGDSIVLLGMSRSQDKNKPFNLLCLEVTTYELHRAYLNPEMRHIISHLTYSHLRKSEFGPIM